MASAEPTIIPPVRAGEQESELSIKYNHQRKGDGGFDATSIHSWTFDMDAYGDVTGLSLGGDYPYVPQENGHTLSLVTDYSWMHNSSGAYTVFVEQKGVRGTYSYDYYFTRCGGYDLNSEMEVTRTYSERQPYRQRESDDEIPHFDVSTLTGQTVESGEEFVRKLHHGLLGESIEEQLAMLLRYDSPEGAVTPEEYRQTTDTPIASAGD